MDCLQYPIENPRARDGGWIRRAKDNFGGNQGITRIELALALYLGVRQGLSWRGRRTHLVLVCGFLLLVVSFCGAPHLLNGVVR